MDRDFLLVRRMKNGDEEAMECFVRKYYPAVLNYCRYHIMNTGYAEDLTQETFARFFRALGDYCHKGKVGNYLYVIAGNLCRDFYKKGREIAMDELPEGETAPFEDIDRKLDMERALAQLPDELREVVILHYFQELKLREAAEVLHIGLPLVKYRIKKAREELARILGREEKT